MKWLIFSTVVFLHFFLYHISSDFCSYGILGRLLKVTLFNGRLFSGFIYLSVAYFLSKKDKYLIKDMFCLFLALFVSVLIPDMDTTMHNIVVSAMRVIFVYGLFSVCLFFQKKHIKFALFAQKASSVMYFTHMLFFFLFSLLFRDVGYKGIDAFVITLFLTILLSWIVVTFFSKKTFARKFL